MNVGILTLPLTNNYGAFLQNFALQIVLKDIGCKPITIDYLPSGPSLIRIICSCIKSIVFFPRSIKKKHFFSIELSQKRYRSFQSFLDGYIVSTKKLNSLNSSVIRRNNLDAVIVGSDQVWRPKYSRNIQSHYLSFVTDPKVKKIAYAASFGVDKWEYSHIQTQACSALAKDFHAVSVRELTGVALCKNHLGVDAVWVLDPTLLLKKEDYYGICECVPVAKDKILVAYILDFNMSVRSMCESIAKERGLVLKVFHSNSMATLTIQEWLAMFRDASYVVTDSFHGTVFSIIFGKEFKCIYNKERGSARFESLLNLHNSGKLEEMRGYSINWLKNALEV